MTESTLLIPTFPNEISQQIIARIQRTTHHQSNLSLVCKPWRSFLHSSLYLALRSQLNCTHFFLYINIRIHNSSFKWFVLDPKKPDKTLSPVPSIPIQAVGSAFAVLGSKIYVIGGSVNDIGVADVWVFDSRFSRWEVVPKMRVGREFAAAGVINGKIYVLGGCLVDNWRKSTNWAEVFDPKIGYWETVKTCTVEIKEKWMHGSAVIGNKMYAMADRGGVAFDPEEEWWGYVSTELDLGWRGRAVVVDDILYCYDYLGKIRGFDGKEVVWRELKGLENDLPKFLFGATMANVGGNLYVVWEVRGSRQIGLSCAEIEVRKDCFGELWGSIVWSQVILDQIPSGSSLVHCLAVEF